MYPRIPKEALEKCGDSIVFLLNEGSPSCCHGRATKNYTAPTSNSTPTEKQLSSFPQKGILSSCII